MSTYQPPLDQLLRLGETDLGVEWLDYQGMGIRSEHVPELIRLATDADLILQADEEGVDDAQAWGCVHALRALAQLDAVEAVEPLLANFDKILDIHDFWVEDFAEAMARIGPDALPACERYFEDQGHDDRHRIALTDSFIKVAQAHPEVRDRVVAYLSRILKDYPENDPAVNGFIVSVLLDLEAAEAAPVIEGAFELDRVDPTIAGDWPLVRYELGLGPKPKESRFGPSLTTGWGGGSGVRRPDYEKAKQKRKQQKQARKQANKRKKKH